VKDNFEQFKNINTQEISKGLLEDYDFVKVAIERHNYGTILVIKGGYYDSISIDPVEFLYSSSLKEQINVQQMLMQKKNQIYTLKVALDWSSHIYREYEYEEDDVIKMSKETAKTIYTRLREKFPSVELLGVESGTV